MIMVYHDLEEYHLCIYNNKFKFIFMHVKFVTNDLFGGFVK